MLGTSCPQHTKWQPLTLDKFVFLIRTLTEFGPVKGIHFGGWLRVVEQIQWRVTACLELWNK